mgnify:CR=1 FL=1
MLNPLQPLNNWKEKADKVQFVAAWLMTRIRLRMDMRLFARDRMMEILGRELATLKGKGMPGKASKYKAHSDPNKNSWDPGTLPTVC